MWTVRITKRAYITQDTTKAHKTRSATGEFILHFCQRASSFSLVKMTQQKANNVSSIPIDAFSNLRITSIWTFLMSVQWSEPWLIGLLVFHVVCLCLTVVTCRYYRAQICHFLLMVGLVYSAEYLNELAAMNWKSFSDFQYFDSKGMFISLVYSIPLLLNTVIIVMVWVYRTFSTMTELKTLQLKRKARREKREKND
ncbi:Transmembrane protein 18 [Collichthys lucidus]|uniref:Transmembrane protein 18 n=1 Tax=Collichthys lucidus TaxID=240159 RepID=A0A4U5UL61_COLLU|nr:Transmembrane protein 18 [Collichthys lucidus]